MRIPGSIPTKGSSLYKAVERISGSRWRRPQILARRRWLIFQYVTGLATGLASRTLGPIRFKVCISINLSKGLWFEVEANLGFGTKMTDISTGPFRHMSQGWQPEALTKHTPLPFLHSLENRQSRLYLHPRCRICRSSQISNSTNPIISYRPTARLCARFFPALALLSNLLLAARSGKKNRLSEYGSSAVSM